MKKNRYIYEVVRNQFYAGAYPRETDDDASIRQIRELIDDGFTCFIDLTEKDESNSGGILMKPYSQMLPGIVKYKRFPIPDVQFPKTMWYLIDILDYIDIQLKNGGKVYLHCRSGYNRTSVIVAAWFVYCGMSPEDSLKTFCECSRKAVTRYMWIPLVLDEDEKPDYIFRFHEWLISNQHKWTTTDISFSENAVYFYNFRLDNFKNISRQAHREKAVLTNLKTGETYRLQYIETKLLLKMLGKFGEYLSYEYLADGIWMLDNANTFSLRDKLKVAIAKLKKKIEKNDLEITNNQQICSYKLSFVNRS